MTGDEMGKSIEGLEGRIRRHVMDHPPSCLSGLEPWLVVHADGAWNGQTEWGIQCACGGEVGEVLGYSLADLNPRYEGPLLFVTPLAFQCCRCERVTEIIDTDRHGYDGENKQKFGGVGAATYRGEGERKTFNCGECGKTHFTVTAGFQYSDFDHVEDEPDLEPVAQDYFDWFVSTGVCAACGKSQCIGDYELA